jgi:hypothetical protein
VTKQAREARDREQAEEWVEAAARAEGAVDKGEVVVDKGEEVVLRLARADIVFAPTAVKEQPIRWEAPVTNRNAPSVERP